MADRPLKRSLRPRLSKNTKPASVPEPFQNVCAVIPSGWWSQSGSNRRPPACKAGALPAELWPRDKYKLVGLGGLEPPTSPLSGVRSNHLSYRPRSDPSMECRKLVRTPAKRGRHCSKGGDPAAPSDTATLLRLHPSHRPHRGKRPPCG